MKKTVKLIFALCLMAALVLSLAACGDKDPVGTWECTNFKDIITEVGEKAGASKEEIDEAMAMFTDFKVSFVFNKDGTFSMKGSLMGESSEFKGTWKATDNGVDITVEDATETLLWDGSKLTFSGDLGVGLGETKFVLEKK